MSHPTTTTAEVRAAASAIATAMGNSMPYAVVGGAACMLLGSDRVTHDVDFVVPKDYISASRRLLKSAGTFTVQPKSNYTTYGHTGVEIDILAPPRMFNAPFNNTTSRVTIGNIPVLHPLLLLNAKCGSLLGRTEAQKKSNDAQDIDFLLRYCKKNSIRVTMTDIPNLSVEFIEYTISQGYVTRQRWESAGYVPGRGFPTA